jgi:hypothetical protein
MYRIQEYWAGANSCIICWEWVNGPHTSWTPPTSRGNISSWDEWKKIDGGRVVNATQRSDNTTFEMPPTVDHYEILRVLRTPLMDILPPQKNHAFAVPFRIAHCLLLFEEAFCQVFSGVKPHDHFTLVLTSKGPNSEVVTDVAWKELHFSWDKRTLRKHLTPRVWYNAEYSRTMQNLRELASASPQQCNEFVRGNWIYPLCDNEGALLVRTRCLQLFSHPGRDVRDVLKALINISEAFSISKERGIDLLAGELKRDKSSARMCGLCARGVDVDACQQCQQCRVLWYCGVECQSAHWAHHQHHCLDLGELEKKYGEDECDVLAVYAAYYLFKSWEVKDID